MQQTARQMRALPPAVREDELRELRGHLEQRAQDFESAGMSAPAAQARAVEGLGSARALGAQLCDAWEGIAWSWWRLAAAVSYVALWLSAQIALVTGMEVALVRPQSALWLELLWAMGTFGLSAVCGIALSQVLGRRGKWTGAALVGVLWIAELMWPQFYSPFALMRDRAFQGSIVPLMSVHLSLILAGAALWDARRRERLMRADFGALTRFEAAPKVLNWRLSPGAMALACGALTLAMALVSAGVFNAFDPQSPRAILRAKLAGQFRIGPVTFASEVLELRALAPQSSAERAGIERKFYYRVKTRLAPADLARGAARFKKWLDAPPARWKHGQKRLRGDLAQLRINAHQARGIARLTKTSAGWRVDQKSLKTAPLPPWAFDLL